MSDKEDREYAKKIIKTAKPGSAAYIEAQGILSGDDPERREYIKTKRDKPKPPMKKKAGGYMKKMKSGGKTSKYNCSHNRLY